MVFSLCKAVAMVVSQCMMACPQQSFLEFTNETAPWAFKHGSDQLLRFIASLELMATLVCVHLFGDSKRDQTLTLSVSTDNLGNSCIVKKFMTTEFPVCCILMRLADALQKKGQSLSLACLPRDDNDLADAIGKRDFEVFDSTLRIKKDHNEFTMMQQLIKTGEDLYDEVMRRKLCRPRSPASSTANYLGTLVMSGPMRPILLGIMVTSSPNRTKSRRQVMMMKRDS